MSFSERMRKICEGDDVPYVLMQRPYSTGKEVIEILLGDVTEKNRLSEIPLNNTTHSLGRNQHDAFVLVPHKQVTERGFKALNDGMPLLVLSVKEQGTLPAEYVRELLPNDEVHLENSGFDIGDDAYIDIVQSVLDKEIRTGSGSNFVIKRSFVTEITEFSTKLALSLFRRLLDQENGAYWIFIFHTGDQTFVGATPERHVSLEQEVAVMNPISGTFRYPAEGLSAPGFLSFLNDKKEKEELFMVLDEELKMMARICDGGGQVLGPYVREMAHLAHTEYYIKGHSKLDPRNILKETLLAPTVTGSPLENACRVIAQYESCGRRYYGGVGALFGRDATGVPSLDSAILIRTANFFKADREQEAVTMQIGVGATLVRHSKAESEVAETHAKAAGILKALKASEHTSHETAAASLKLSEVCKDADVQKALSKRNENVSNFWLQHPTQRARSLGCFSGKSVLVIDAEDNFTSMLAVQLQSLGFNVNIAMQSKTKISDFFQHDLVVLGPGPGDPSDCSNHRIARMERFTEQLLHHQIPFLSVCLSHQLLCKQLGYKLRRLPQPNQGTQASINLFGRTSRVGFYNSFAAYNTGDNKFLKDQNVVELFKDENSNEIHAVKGSHFASMQFHVESVLTEDPLSILVEFIQPVLADKVVLAS